jgi:hypothetical protein
MGEHEIAKAMLDNVADAAALVEQAAEASAERAAEQQEAKPAATTESA